MSQNHAGNDEDSAGDILIKLYADEAPETVGNFVKLVEMGHYNGLHFHRVIQDFMIQGAALTQKIQCPQSRNRWPGLANSCEASALALKHDRPGILSMANAGRNTGGSQFSLPRLPRHG